jgi:hypothetical protein
LSHQRENKTNKNKTKLNSTKQKKIPQSVPSSDAIQFQYVFQHAGVVWLLSHQRERGKKKESGDSSENGICHCGSPAGCCQPAVAAGGVIYADLRGELNTHLAPQALFTQSSPGHDVTATSFPPSKHTGGSDTAPVFSGWCVYL